MYCGCMNYSSLILYCSLRLGSSKSDRVLQSSQVHEFNTLSMCNQIKMWQLLCSLLVVALNFCKHIPISFNQLAIIHLPNITGVVGEEYIFCRSQGRGNSRKNNR